MTEEQVKPVEQKTKKCNRIAVIGVVTTGVAAVIGGAVFAFYKFKRG